MNKKVIYRAILLVLIPTIITTAPRGTVTDTTRNLSSALDSSVERKYSQSSKGLDQTTKEVLLNFGNVIGNFFVLLQNTDNPQHVGNCLQGMIAGMVNIGVAAMKSKNILDPEINGPITAGDIAALVSNVQDALKDIIYIKCKKYRYHRSLRKNHFISLSKRKNKTLIH